MDGNRFDDLAKVVATGGTSRRRLFTLLGGGAAAGIGRLVFGSQASQAAASHLCCTYQCGETYTTSCSRQGACPPPPVGCTTLDSSYFVKRCKDCAPRFGPPTEPPACPEGQHCSGGLCCDEGFVACPGNPAGCIPAATACSGEPVCCSDLGTGAGIVCGFQGVCQAGSAPPPATCPPGA